MNEIATDEVARRLQHSAKAVREWMAQDCPPEDTPKLQIALLAEFARSVADAHLKRHNALYTSVLQAYPDTPAI